MDRESRVYVAGHRGLVGSALMRKLRSEGYGSILTRTRAELDLTDTRAVHDFFWKERPEYLFLAAARVGGILANSLYPADFIRENLSIQTNVIDAAYRSGVKKLLFLGSSCIYPKLASQPLKEEYLMTGLLEPTNEPFAVAKIAGIKMCQSYRYQYGFRAVSPMVTNVYGPNSNFDPGASHVVAALIRKFHEAKVSEAGEVVIWGTGMARREFIHVDDLADACVYLMQVYEDPGIINVGVGEDISIRDLAGLISVVVGFSGGISYDCTKPDGAPRKLLDVGRLRNLGWSPRIPLEEGIRQTYEWYCQQLVTGV